MRLLTGAARAFEVEVDTSHLLFLFLLLVLADDDRHALARHAGVNDEALASVVEVHSDTARVVDARRLTVRDRRRAVPHSTRDVTVSDRLPDVRTTTAAHTYQPTHDARPRNQRRPNVNMVVKSVRLTLEFTTFLKSTKSNKYVKSTCLNIEIQCSNAKPTA